MSNTTTTASNDGVQLLLKWAHGMSFLCISFFFFFVLTIIYAEQSLYVQHHQHSIEQRRPATDNASQNLRPPVRFFYFFLPSFTNTYLYYLTDLHVQHHHCSIERWPQHPCTVSFAMPSFRLCKLHRRPGLSALVGCNRVLSG